MTDFIPLPVRSGLTWLLVCPSTGRQIGLHEIPEHCSMHRHPDGLVVWGHSPVDSPMFLGLYEDHRDAFRACEKWRKKLPGIVETRRRESARRMHGIREQSPAKDAAAAVRAEMSFLPEGVTGEI